MPHGYFNYLVRFYVVVVFSSVFYSQTRQLLTIVYLIFVCIVHSTSKKAPFILSAKQTTQWFSFSFICTSECQAIWFAAHALPVCLLATQQQMRTLIESYLPAKNANVMHFIDSFAQAENKLKRLTTKQISLRSQYVLFSPFHLCSDCALEFLLFVRYRWIVRYCIFIVIFVCVLFLNSHR